MEFFTHPDKLNPMDITTNRTTPAEKYRDNGASPLHGTQTSLMHSPLTDASAATDDPLPRLCIEDGNSTRLVSLSELPKVRLKGANISFYGVFQDWVHQNPGNHFDGGIKEDGKWQAR